MTGRGFPLPKIWVSIYQDGRNFECTITDYVTDEVLGTATKSTEAAAIAAALLAAEERLGYWKPPRQP